MINFDEYDSPIKCVITSIENKIDNEILKAVFHVGIKIDKEELFKALYFDRHQYEKGYEKGYEEGYKQAISNIEHNLKKFKES